MDKSANPTLKRVVSRWEIVALSINDVIGSGVYLILPVSAAKLLGPASIFAILAAGLGVLCIVLCFAEAASRFQEAGGAFVYARAAFGDAVGFQIGWLTWIARVSSVAGLSVFFARAVGNLWAEAQAGWGQRLVIVLLLSVLTGINVAGVKAGAKTAVVLAIGKLLPLFLLIGAGLFSIAWDRVGAMSAPSTDSLGRAALLVLFAYAGFENTPAPAAEFQNPKRDLPFALMVQISTVTAIYTLVQLVAIGVVPNLGSSQTPLADAGRILFGPFGGVLLTLGAVVSVLGTNNSSMLAGPRYLYALAESGHLPSFFARIHPRFRTPYVAIITQAVAGLLLVFTGTAEDLAELSVMARLATYVGTAAAVPVLRKRPAEERTFQVPGGLTVPIIALALCALLIASATVKNLIAGGIALAIGAVLFAIGRRRA